MTLRVASSVGAATLALLLLAPAAAAKGRATLEICGASACRTFEADPRGAQRHVELVFGIMNEAYDSTSFAGSPPPSASYTLRLAGEWLDDRPSRTYVPSARVLSVGNDWVVVEEKLAGRLARAVAGLLPAPPPRVRAVTVAGRAAVEPAPYARLLGALPPASVPASWEGGVEIVLEPDRITPWADPARPLRFFPDVGVLRRGSDWVRVPPDLALVIEADAAPAPPVSSGFPAGYARAGLAVLAAALLAVGAFGRRRRARAGGSGGVASRPA